MCQGFVLESALVHTAQLPCGNAMSTVFMLIKHKKIQLVYKKIHVLGFFILLYLNGDYDNLYQKIV